jgi:hypothetical protein
MDTYYYGTGRVLDALDFYATRISPEHLSIGMSSTGRPNMDNVQWGDRTNFSSGPTVDGFTARFEALNLYKITDVTMFMMPTTETWMPYLRKWKNNCAGCPNGGALSCWANTACY